MGRDRHCSRIYIYMRLVLTEGTLSRRYHCLDIGPGRTDVQCSFVGQLNKTVGGKTHKFWPVEVRQSSGGHSSDFPSLFWPPQLTSLRTQRLKTPFVRTGHTSTQPLRTYISVIEQKRFSTASTTPHPIPSRLDKATTHQSYICRYDYQKKKGKKRRWSSHISTF